MVGIGLGFVKGGGAAAAEPWYSGVNNLSVSDGSATVTADTLAHTKGAWTEIIASNGAATDMILLRVGVSQSATNTATLVDLAVGASGSETPIVQNVAIGSGSGLYTIIPMSVASGARLSARIQSIVTGGKTAGVQLETFSFGGVAPGTVDILGTSTATSRGTAVTSSWTEVVASTSHTYAAIGVLASAGDATQVIGAPLVEVGYGASGSEVVVHEANFVTGSTETVQTGTNAMLISGASIPAGSRLAAQSSVNLDVTIIGVRA